MKKILLLLSIVFLADVAFAVSWKCPAPARKSTTTTTKKKAAPVSAATRRANQNLLWRNDVVKKAREFGLITQFTVVDGQPTWIIGQPINPKVAQHDLERDTRLLEYTEERHNVYVQLDEDFIQKCNGRTYWFFTYVFTRF
ncbi:MAG: hypothetical protein ACRCVN_04595 [Spirochaetia bacterium]